MKKFLLLAFVVFIGYSAQSQVLISIILGDKLNSPNLEFGLEGGNNWSTISSLQSGKPLSTFNLGFYFDIRVKNDFYFYTGVLVLSTLGNDRLTNSDLLALGADTYSDSSGTSLDGDYSQRLNYFLVPLLAKYRHKSNVYVEAGPQLGWAHKSYVEFTYDNDGKEAIIKEFNLDHINRIDAGILVGTGYKFKKGPGWSLGVKYYHGFVDVYKNISNTKHSSLFVKVNIPIGAGNKTDKQ